MSGYLGGYTGGYGPSVVVEPTRSHTPDPYAAPTLARTIRFDVLDVDDNLLGVCHPVITSGTVAWSSGSNIQRTLAGIEFAPGDAAELEAGVTRLRPVWVHPDGTEKTLGVFLYLGGPVAERTTGDWIKAAQMPDRTWQLDQPLPYSFGVDGGTSITTAIEALFTLAGITDTQCSIVETAAVTGTEPLAWSAGDTTALAVAKTLTELAAYLPPHTDNDGRVSIRPVPRPGDDTPNHVYAAGQNGRVIADTITSNTDITDRPNRYLVRSTTPSGEALAATYDVPATAANSRQRIGYYVTKPIDADGLATTAQALEVAKAHARADAAVVREVTFAGLPDPRHDAYGIVEWNDERMLEQSWSLPLSGAEMTHRLTATYEDT